MVSYVAISPDDSEGVVLAKVMKVAKEIRPGDKKRVKTGVKTPINRRSGWWPGGSVVCWRMVWPAVVDGWRLMLQAGGCCPFWVPERQGGRASAGAMTAAISGGWRAKREIFNQLLTIFLVVAMVWRLTVF